MSIRIQHTTKDGEPVRRFFLIAEVTFSDAKKDGGDNYFTDDEMPYYIRQWTDAALDDREDGPRVTFHDVPPILDVDLESIARGDYPGWTP